MPAARNDGGDGWFDRLTMNGLEGISGFRVKHGMEYKKGGLQCKPPLEPPERRSLVHAVHAAHTAHTAAATTHCRSFILFRDIGDQGFSNQHHSGDAGRIL